MNGKTRIAMAMRHQIPDRVPVMCQLSLGHYFINMRDHWKPHEIWFTSEAFADSLVTMSRRYQFDGVLVNLPGRDPDWRQHVRSIEDGPEGEIITWNDGSRVTVPPDDNAQYEPVDTALPEFMDFDPDRDFDRLDSWPGYTWAVYHMPYLAGKSPGLLLEPPEYFYRTIDMVRAAVGEELSVHGEVFSPFTHFLELFGYQNALMGLAIDPSRCEIIIDRLTQAVIAWGRGQAQRGVDALLISSAFAGGGFISKAMYSQFVVPYERMVVDAIHTEFPDLPVYTHTCGRLGDRLELMASSNTDGVDTLDPPPLGDSDLADAKARIGHHLFIKGNINAVALLTDSETEVIARARLALEAGKPNGGYILSTACSVAPHVSPEKLQSLAQVADQYGRYE